MLSKYKFIRVAETSQNSKLYIITLDKPPENRLNVESCQEIIRALREVEATIRPDSPGAVIITSSSPKFFTTGLDLDERSVNKFSSSDGFYPLLATLLDYPLPTIAAITGHTFGGSCLFALACDYRVMTSQRGYFSMPPVIAGLHHPGMGSLPRLKLGARVARKLLLEAHRFTGKEALEAGIVDYLGDDRDAVLAKAKKIAESVKGKATMGVYGLLRNELVGEAREWYARNSYVHRMETAREPKVKL